MQIDLELNKILVISDNYFLINEFYKIVKEQKLNNKYEFDFRCSLKSPENIKSLDYIKVINVKDEVDSILENYNLVFSLHCKQLFPEKLVNEIKCINIHPGYNPYNRGYFPQVFSIINKLPVGVTIHEMDSQLDHGDIIIQEKIEIYEHETSLDVYNRVLNLEIELLKNHLQSILNGDYKAMPMKEEGNLNYFKDYKDLCKLDLDEKLTMREAIDKLRAFTHKPYANAYFINKDDEKINVEINLYNKGKNA